MCGATRRLRARDPEAGPDQRACDERGRRHRRIRPRVDRRTVVSARVVVGRDAGGRPSSPRSPRTSTRPREWSYAPTVRACTSYCVVAVSSHHATLCSGCLEPVPNARFRPRRNRAIVFRSAGRVCESTTDSRAPIGWTQQAAGARCRVGARDRPSVRGRCRVQRQAVSEANLHTQRVAWQVSGLRARARNSPWDRARRVRPTRDRYA